MFLAPVTTTLLHDIVPSSPARHNGTCQMAPFSPRFTNPSVHIPSTCKNSNFARKFLCELTTKYPEPCMHRQRYVCTIPVHHSTNIMLICRRQWFSTGGKMNNAREGGSTVQIGSYIVTLGKSTPPPFFYSLHSLK